ncbi:hypothetical protein SAMN04489859_100885 [Paracoccus alcaliphilus]|uniref:Uncharacterized protein n=1 Tax=Paracoccus alcaliphilus TaxID=34002 RepID=A0A1H8H2Y5_9RHOB|nr:hypothetical protein [Paracoccus alcaliphilus]WCR17409.1 hypothetical protein JHW40_13810 [Paracoccus alcaliphilus]SEN50379.1 hypothetical protein SAMN04489859_100885 [Paracoccus alcaliphilus]
MKMSLMCDASGCDHIEYVDGITSDLIGKPCPKCGENLLTDEDYKESMPIFAAWKIILAMGIISSPDDPRSEGTLVEVRHHDGETTVKTKVHKP